MDNDSTFQEFDLSKYSELNKKFGKLFNAIKQLNVSNKQNYYKFIS